MATAVVGVSLSCQNSETRPQSAAFGGSGLSNGGSGSASGNSGKAGNGASDGSSSGGSAGSGVDGGGQGGGSGVPSVDTACDRSMAFWATGASFVFPTPKPLAYGLGPLTYDYGEHPITVVLAVQSGAATVAASATDLDTSGQSPGFVGEKPQFVPAILSAGGFASSASQQRGWLRIKDQSGFKDIEMNNIELSVVTSNQCSTILAQLTAVIPSSEGGVVLDLPSGSTTLEALAGASSSGGKSPEVGWNLRLVFAGESTDFDFASL
ncbi:MAG: hypothetical protein R3B13_37005 [Polyangiaceae bacterium]